MTHVKGAHANHLSHGPERPIGILENRGRSCIADNLQSQFVVCGRRLKGVHSRRCRGTTRCEHMQDRW